jgi:hypothetical protein
MLLHIIFLFFGFKAKENGHQSRGGHQLCKSKSFSLSILSFSPLSFSLTLSLCIRVVLWLGKDQVHNIITKKYILNKNCKVSPYFDNKRVDGTCLMTWSQFAMVM